jgi:hypothetical protein
MTKEQKDNLFVLEVPMAYPLFSQTKILYDLKADVMTSVNVVGTMISQSNNQVFFRHLFGGVIVAFIFK